MIGLRGAGGVLGNRAWGPAVTAGPLSLIHI